MTTEKEKTTLEKAKDLIASVKGKSETTEQRKNRAIELAALILTESRKINREKRDVFKSNWLA